MTSEERDALHAELALAGITDGFARDAAELVLTARLPHWHVHHDFEVTWARQVLAVQRVDNSWSCQHIGDSGHYPSRARKGLTVRQAARYARTLITWSDLGVPPAERRLTRPDDWADMVNQWRSEQADLAWNEVRNTRGFVARHPDTRTSSPPPGTLTLNALRQFAANVRDVTPAYP